MITKIKQVIHFPDTNSVEVTWFEETVDWSTGTKQETPVRCHSYADSQLDMLESDLGADAAEYAELIAIVRAAIKPLPPEPVIVPQIISKAQGLIALELAGKLEAIERYMATAPRIEQIAWANIRQFERPSLLLNKLCGNFGLDSAAVDQLFIVGAAVVI